MGLEGSARLGSYLRRLREGHGLSLRQLADRLCGHGLAVDSSQLSRYERGLHCPSFAALRALASALDVTVQSFSDVLELPIPVGPNRPSGRPSKLIEAAEKLARAGDRVAALACCARAIELLDGRTRATGQALRARVLQADLLLRLGMTALAEANLKSALGQSRRMRRALRVEALVVLSAVYRCQGIDCLAEIVARQAVSDVRSLSGSQPAARAVHALATVLADRGHDREAIERFTESASLFRGHDDVEGANQARLARASCFVNLGKSREGMRQLRLLIREARSAGARRLEGLSWCGLAEAYRRAGRFRRSADCLGRAEAAANRAGDRDILFRTALCRWRIAVEQANPIRIRIAWGRLKALRSGQDWSPDIAAFDRLIRKGESET